MILYVNGDSHTAAAEAVVPAAFALDDGKAGINIANCREVGESTNGDSDETERQQIGQQLHARPRGITNEDQAQHHHQNCRHCETS